MPMSVDFSLETFVTKALLGGLHVAMDRAEVLACLGDPDDWMVVHDDSKVRSPIWMSSRIWKYGSFEVHFVDDDVSQIYVDDIESLHAGEGRALDINFLEMINDYDHVLDHFHSSKIPVSESLRHQSKIIHIEKGADLIFEKVQYEWKLAAVVVDGSSLPSFDDEWQKVYTAEWYDGPREGIANYNGKPHYYYSEFLDLDGEEDRFGLVPIGDEIFRLELEDWQIWLRWARKENKTVEEHKSHPALPNEHTRWQEIQIRSAEIGISSPGFPAQNPLEASFFATAEFEASGSDNGHASFVVRWQRLS